MDIRSLNIFLEAAELGSFTRTGEKLGYSQPTVSFQIRQLERELGVVLFDRISHTVTLTEAGQDALLYAQQICALSREMMQSAENPREISGTLRLGMADSLCTPLIASRFSRLRQQYPRLALTIIPAGTDELFRLLNHNDVDLVCTLDSHIYDAAYVIADEEQIGVHFVASPASPLAKKQEISIVQLPYYPLLLTETLVPMEKWKRDALSEILQSWLELTEEALAERSGRPALSPLARALSQSRTPSELLEISQTLRKANDYTMSNVSPAAVCGWLVWALR